MDYLPGQEAFCLFTGKRYFAGERLFFSKNGSDKAPFNHVACQCRNLLRGLRRILIQPGFNQADAARYEEGIVVIKGL